MSHRHRVFSFAWLVVASLVVPSVRAEVGCIHVSSGDPDGYVFSIQEDPNPVPSAWIPISATGTELRVVLNSDGAARGDGEPRMIDHPVTGTPIVVWSRNANPGYDVVISRFVDGAWSQPQVIAGGPDAELDPAIAIDPGDGSVHVVYWVLSQPPASSARVLHVQAPADLSTWTTPVEVSAPGEYAARPAAAFHAGQLHVVYEAALGDGPPYYVLLATRSGNAWGATILLGTSTFGGSLWPEIHSMGNSLWAEWIDAVDSMAWMKQETGQSWSTLQSEQYTTFSDRDFFARGRIRGKAIH
jgi:hypothetical protein